MILPVRLNEQTNKAKNSRTTCKIFIAFNTVGEWRIEKQPNPQKPYATTKVSETAANS